MRKKGILNEKVVWGQYSSVRTQCKVLSYTVRIPHWLNFLIGPFVIMEGQLTSA